MGFRYIAAKLLNPWNLLNTSPTTAGNSTKPDKIGLKSWCLTLATFVLYQKINSWLCRLPVEVEQIDYFTDGDFPQLHHLTRGVLGISQEH